MDNGKRTDLSNRLAEVVPTDAQKPAPYRLRCLQLSPEEAAQRRREVEEARERHRRAEIASRMHPLAHDLGKRYTPGLTRLDSFEMYHPNQAPVLEKLRGLMPAVADFVRAGRALILFGCIGTGKDHLLSSMLYSAVMAGVTARWVGGQDFYQRLRDTMNSHRTGPSFLYSLLAPDVLGVSDPTPPIGAASDWCLQQLYLLIDKRYREQKATWLTMNLRDIQGADAALSGPVFDRLRHDGVFIKCDWPSYRERQQAGRQPK